MFYPITRSNSISHVLCGSASMDSGSEEEGNVLPKKRALTTCVIHCSDNPSDSKSLVSPKDLDSFRTILKAAEIRKYAPLLDIAKGLPEGEMPPAHMMQYHRKCRSIFTMNKLLESIAAKETSTKSDTDRTRRSSRDESSTSRVYEKICIFCNKSSKYLNCSCL